MSLLTVAPQVATLVVRLADQVPDDNDVVAGWTAFAIFIGLVIAVALLGWSLTKQLRKAQAAEDAGLYDPSDRKPPQTIPMAEPSEPGAASTAPVDPDEPTSS